MPPFFSGSAAPLFIGFTGAGLPVGVRFSFLIFFPMVDLGSVVLLMSIFGAKVAIVYVIFGMVVAVVGGTIIEKLHMERYVEDFIKNARSVDIASPELTKSDRIIYAKDQVGNTFKNVLSYILVGVGIGAVIHNWIPESVVETVLGGNNPLGTVPSFMMAGTILSLPSLIMLRKAVKPKLLGLFIAICTVGIIIVGYLFKCFIRFWYKGTPEGGKDIHIF